MNNKIKIQRKLFNMALIIALIDTIVLFLLLMVPDSIQAHTLSLFFNPYTNSSWMSVLTSVLLIDAFSISMCFILGD